MTASVAGRYELLEPIGEGGMGRVVRAHDTVLDREVAVKLLPEVVQNDPKRRTRFEREARAAAALNHPNIVVVHDFGSDGGRPYVIMELLEGSDLRARLLQGPLPWRAATEVASQVARGLDAAHREGVIHRDLKPANLFITRDGNVKILDFGLAKLASPESVVEVARATTAPDGTEIGAILGTVGYMSPEQVLGRAVDARSDLFSLGVLLYEALTGRRPFVGESAPETMHAILTEEPPPLSSSGRKIPLALQEILRRCLEKQPERRFSSAHDLALALQAVSVGSDPPAATQIPGVAGPEQRHGRRRVAAALGVGALAAAVGLWQWTERTSGSSRAPAGPKRLAVLPFENLGAPEDAYFADGMADEVRGKLASLSGMTVIARASSDQYRGSGKPPGRIAAELGATYLLSARVRWEKHSGGCRIRVTPELVEVGGSAAPTTRWQGSYDADLEDVFRVQSEIAARVARALELALDVRERERLAERPTKSLAAYDAFLRGQQVLVSLPTDPLGGLRAAIVDFERAVALDPSFALAWAQLSRTKTLVMVNGVPSRDLAEGAREAASRAVELAPNLAEARLALGYSRWLGDHDVPGALEVLEPGLADHPRNADLLAVTAVVKGAQGRWGERLAMLERAASLDPHWVYAVWSIGRHHLWHGRYREAREALDRALALDPEFPEAIWDMAKLYLAQGDVAGARAFVAATSANMEPSRVVALMADSWATPLSWLLDEGQRETLLRFAPSAFGEDAAKWELILAQERVLRGDAARAREHAEKAVAVYASRVAEYPSNTQLHVCCGIALAILGRRAEALREGERALALLPIARDAYMGPGLQLQVVRICILAGEHERALDLLEPLLEVPYALSPAWLAVDPAFAPLHGSPRFERLASALNRAIPATPVASSGSSGPSPQEGPVTHP